VRTIRRRIMMMMRRRRMMRMMLTVMMTMMVTMMLTTPVPTASVRELGDTRYEKGADGLMLTVMTDARHVSYERIASDWDVKSLLRMIARRPEAER
jgi:hypothetical protein